MIALPQLRLFEKFPRCRLTQMAIKHLTDKLLLWRPPELPNTQQQVKFPGRFVEFRSRRSS
jgi:hypothetical protein